MIKKIIRFFKKKKSKKGLIKKKIKIKNIKKRKSISKKKIKRLKPSRTLEVNKEKLIAVVTHYFSKIKVAVLKMKDILELNNKIHIKGFTTDFTQKVNSMQYNHKPIKIAKKRQEIGLLVKSRVRHNDKVYKIE